MKQNDLKKENMVVKKFGFLKGRPGVRRPYFLITQLLFGLALLVLAVRHTFQPEVQDTPAFEAARNKPQMGDSSLPGITRAGSMGMISAVRFHRTFGFDETEQAPQLRAFFQIAKQSGRKSVFSTFFNSNYSALLAA
jgi:hypothetical protein